MDFATECRPEHAEKFALWIADRGGLAIWRSVDLSDLRASWTTPVLDPDGKPYQKPHWKAGNTPEIVTDPARVGVYTEVLFKSIRVSLRRGSNGLSLKLTDASQRRVDVAMAACKEKHGSSHYRTGDLMFPSVEVFYTSKVVPLVEYIAKQGAP